MQLEYQVRGYFVLIRRTMRWRGINPLVRRGFWPIRGWMLLLRHALR
ncbi:MAG: hypothetical protein QOG55_2212 [Acidobacteriaceae bacterium]|jgi:hypothetical protein|nr:hypothetical protein [Acidobacteriaceae bacterium]